MDNAWEYLQKFGMLEPFDPSKHTEMDIGLGGPSTEYIATENAPDGGFWNIPTIWFDKGGKPLKLDNYNSAIMAREYEDKTGKMFPRFKTPGAGSFAAMNRSAMGGANQGSLATFSGRK